MARSDRAEASFPCSGLMRCDIIVAVLDLDLDLRAMLMMMMMMMEEQ